MLRQSVHRLSVLSPRSWLFLALLACVAVMTTFPAHAGGNVSVGIGYWSGPGHHHHYRHHGGHWGPRYRSSVMIYPAPVYVAPRPVYYPSYPVYPAPVPVPVVRATQQCMQYNGDAIIDNSGQPFYGRACLFTDGRWHIVP